ncbi:hypothetical protein VTI28DRAFT_4012 [Corynascus sepedonium]
MNPIPNCQAACQRADSAQSKPPFVIFHLLATVSVVPGPGLIVGHRSQSATVHTHGPLRDDPLTTFGARPG